MGERAYRIAVVVIVAAIIAGGVWWKLAHRSGGAGTAPPPAATGTVRALTVADSAAGKPDRPLPSLLEFGMGKCKQCIAMKPIIAELAHEYEGRADVREVDIAAQPEVAERHNVLIIPAQVFLAADGSEVYRHEGFMPKDDIVAKLAEMGVE